MKEHLLNLIYLQYEQERKLDLLAKEEGDINVYDAYVDVLGIVLDIIGYPKENIDKKGEIPEEDIYSRDWFYQKLTDIAMSTENETIAKQKIENYFNWVCGETLELYKKNKLKTDDFLSNIFKIE